jgi:hypothetical protein
VVKNDYGSCDQDTVRFLESVAALYRTYQPWIAPSVWLLLGGTIGVVFAAGMCAGYWLWHS